MVFLHEEGVRLSVRRPLHDGCAFVVKDSSGQFSFPGGLTFIFEIVEIWKMHKNAFEM